MHVGRWDCRLLLLPMWLPPFGFEWLTGLAGSEGLTAVAAAAAGLLLPLAIGEAAILIHAVFGQCYKYR